METLQEQFRNAIIERMRQCIELGIYKMGICRLQLKEPPEQCPVLKYKTYAKMLDLVCYCESFDIEEILDKLPPFKKCPSECTECRLIVEVEHVVQFCRKPVIQDTIIQCVAPEYFSCVKGTANECIFTSVNDQHIYNAVFYYGINLLRFSYFLAEANKYNFSSFYLRIMKDTWVEKKEYENISRNELERIIDSEIRGKESLFLIIALPKKDYLSKNKELTPYIESIEPIVANNVGKTKYNKGNKKRSTNIRKNSCFGCFGLVIIAFFITIFLSGYSLTPNSKSDMEPTVVEEPTKNEKPTPTSQQPTTELKNGRIWTNRKDGRTITAEFIEYKNGKATVLRDNGKTVSIPLNLLSDADREYVKSAKKQDHIE